MWQGLVASLKATCLLHVCQVAQICVRRSFRNLSRSVWYFQMSDKKQGAFSEQRASVRNARTTRQKVGR